MDIDEAHTWAMLMLDEYGLTKRGWKVAWDEARRPGRRLPLRPTDHRLQSPHHPARR